jgi:hypothetical protein
LGPFLPRQILGFRRGRLFVEKSTSGHYSREGAKSTLLLLALRPTSVANSFQDNSARWGAEKFCLSEIKNSDLKKKHFYCFIQMGPIVSNHFSASMKGPVVYAFIRKK